MAIVLKSELKRQTYGACAQYSIRHALLLVGIKPSMREIFKATRKSQLGVTINGTDEKRIKNALMSFGCIAKEYKLHSFGLARMILNGLLMHHIPVILSVEADEHWVVIAGHRGKKYVWIDSADKKLTGAWLWSELVEWIDNDEIYFIGVSNIKQ
jgi:ABC-type bacteriocin/lantibiotic exporter with double-glycine peptidase domain